MLLVIFLHIAVNFDFFVVYEITQLHGVYLFNYKKKTTTVSSIFTLYIFYVSHLLMLPNTASRYFNVFNSK